MDIFKKAIRLIKVVLPCQHVFIGSDMKPRDGRGLVVWSCSKCHQVFEEPYGLLFEKHGQIKGPWTISEKD